jgi:CMP/dCMP kinase
MKVINVAIDGPAGAGKSTIAKMLAKKLNFVYIDTGAMYRAITYKALKLNINLGDESQYQFLDSTNIQLTEDDRVLIDGEDVTKEIRERDVTNHVSAVSSLKIVREKLVNLQREMAKKTNVIMDGRDIGSHVLTDAQVKIYLTASVDERAKRRYLELLQTKAKSEVDYDKLKEEINRRDYLDSNRELNPLKQAEDALLVDTSNYSIDEVINKLSEIILGRVNI